MRVFTYVVYFLAAIAIITGLMDIINGVAGVKSMGAELSDDGYRDPMLDNLFRFFAAVWFGLGLQLVFFVRDYDRYRPALLLLLGIVTFGGIARLISLAQYGFPEPAIGTFLVCLGLFAELVIAPALIWYARQHSGKS